MDLTAACHRQGLGHRLVLVDRTPYHQLITHLHRVATGGVGLENCRLPFEELLVPGSFELACATVSDLDPTGSTLQLEDGTTLAYDRLAIALGSVPAAPDIEGLEQHGFRLRWWCDAERLRAHIRRAFARAAAQNDPRRRGEWLTFAVAGAGATGCQLVGELAHWLPRLATEHGLRAEEIRILLLESGSRILSGLDPESSRYAHETLGGKGVEIFCDTPLIRVAESSISLGGGTTLAARTAVWTGGNQAPPLLAAAGLPVGSQGRVRVDSRLRVVGFPKVYVAGDAALVEHRGAFLPATAAVAQHQGAFAAAAITHEMQGRAVAEYRPREVGKLVSLGGEDAVGNMLGLPLQGPGAGFVKDNIERWYESTVTRRLPLVDL